MVKKLFLFCLIGCFFGGQVYSVKIDSKDVARKYISQLQRTTKKIARSKLEKIINAEIELTPKLKSKLIGTAIITAIIFNMTDLIRNLCLKENFIKISNQSTLLLLFSTIFLYEIEEKSFKGKKALAEILIESGVPVNVKNRRGNNILHKILISGQITAIEREKFIKFFLEKGVDVNSKNNYRDTPLQHLLYQSHIPFEEQKKIAKILLENKASINTKDNTDSGLLHKIFQSKIPETEREDFIRLFLKKGINVNSQDDLGNTPLHDLLFQSHIPENLVIKYAKILLEEKARLTQENNVGISPLHLMSHKIQLALQKYTDVKPIDPKKRFLNAIILVNHSKEAVKKKSDPLFLSLQRAIDPKANYYIITGGSVFSGFLKAEEDNIEKLEGWKVYKHINQQTSIFLLVPEQYEEKIFDEWKKCRRAHNAPYKELDEIEPVSKCTYREIALGLKVDHDFLKEYDKKELEIFRDTQITFPQKSCLEELLEIFVKNKNYLCSGAWNIIQRGHGSPTVKGLEGRIVNFLISDYRKEIQFFNKNLNMQLLLNTTCYIAGLHHFLAYEMLQKTSLKKTPFPIFSFGTTDGPTNTGTPLHPTKFFNACELYPYSLKITNEKLLKLWFNPKSIFQLTRNIPFVRPKNSPRFMPVRDFDKQIKRITHSSAQAAQLENKSIIVRPEERLVLLLGNAILAKVILKEWKNKMIVSPFPGSCIHVLNQIICEGKEGQLLEFFSNVFFEPAEFTNLVSQKIFIIKKMFFGEKLNYIRELDNVVIIIDQYPSNHRKTLGYVSFEEHEKKTNQAIWSGYTKNYLAEYSPEELSPQSTFRKMNDTISHPPFIGYLQKNMLLIRQENGEKLQYNIEMPLWAKDYRPLIKSITTLIDNNMIQDFAPDPWSLFWREAANPETYKIKSTKEFKKRYSEDEKIFRRLYFDFIKKNKISGFVNELQKMSSKNFRDARKENLLYKVMTSKDLEKNNKQELIRLLIDEDINCYQLPGKEPFISIAMQEKMFDVVEDLVKAGTNLAGTDALSIALKENKQELAKIIFRYGGEVGKGGLLPCIFEDSDPNFDFVNFLISKGANLNEKKSKDKAALHIAIQNKNLKSMEFLLSKEGIDVNIKDRKWRTPLHQAVIQENVKIAKKLLNVREIDVREIDVNAQDEDGRTPLHHASIQGNEKIAIPLLRDDDINVNLQDDDGQTPLHHAITQGNKKITRKLLKEDPNVNLQDRKGRTSLHYAVIKKDAKTTEEIIEYEEPNLKLRDKKGLTPQEYAIEEGDDEIIKLFN